MKTLGAVTTGVLVLFGMGVMASVQARQGSNVTEDRKAMVASYEEKIAAQEALIAEHEQRNPRFTGRYSVGEFGMPERGRTEEEKTAAQEALIGEHEQASQQDKGRYSAGEFGMPERGRTEEGKIAAQDVLIGEHEQASQHDKGRFSVGEFGVRT